MSFSVGSAAETEVVPPPSAQETLDAGPPEFSPKRDDEDGAERSFSRYKILGELGRGGMGIVYKTFDPKLKRVVALKVLLAGEAASGEDIERFFREAESAAKLHHPNIVPIHELDIHEGKHFFTMDFIEGLPLSKVIRDGDITPRRAVEITRDVALAVQHAHEQGVIHRDLKPGNILMTEDGRPMVTDFGLAKQVQADSSLTQSGTALGTPSYMAPEQALGRMKEIDARTDVYALGAVLYEMIADLPPFLGATPFEVMEKVAYDDPFPPRTYSRACPTDVETICLKCLEKDRARRYASAADLADDCRRFLEGEPIAARPASVIYRVRKKLARHKAVVTVCALAVALLVGLTGWYLVSLRSALAEKERQLYFSQIELAQRCWDEANVGRMREALDRCPQHLRNWEWGRLSYVAHLELATLTGHDGPVVSVAWSPDGRNIASAGTDGTVRVWDVETGRELWALTGLRVTSLAYGPRGTCIATGCEDKTVRLCDAQAGQITAVLKGHRDLVTCVAFSPDARRIASASLDETVKLWDAATGEEVMTLSGHTRSVMSVVFSPDGKRIVSGSRGSAHVWDAETGQVVMRLRGTRVAYGPDGTRIASAVGNDVAIWDAGNGEQLGVGWMKGHKDQVRCLAFSPDGKTLASGSRDGTVRLWLTDRLWLTETEIPPLRGHKAVYAVCFSPDGRYLVSGGNDGTLKIWDARRGREVTILRGYPHAMSGAYSPNGKRVVLAAHSSVDAQRTALVWDAEDNHAIATLTGHSDQVRCVAWSPDGKRIVSGSNDRTVKLWNAESGRELVTLKGHDNPVLCVAFGPDGKRITSGSIDRTVRVWDADTGGALLVLEGHNHIPTSVVFSCDGGRIAAGGVVIKGEVLDEAADPAGAVVVWHSRDGRRILTLNGTTSPIAFSPDGRYLASFSYGKGAGVSVWHVSTGGEVVRLQGHKNSVTSLAYTTDGKRIATGSDDNTVRIWDVEAGRQLMTLRGYDEGVRFVSYASDGLRLAVGCQNETYILNADPWEEVGGIPGPPQPVTITPKPVSEARPAGAGEDDEQF